MLGPVVALPVVALIATALQDPVYEASADVLVDRQGIAATSLIGQTPALDDAERTMGTQAQLARSTTVLERTLRAAGERASASQLEGNSVVFSLGDVLRFTVSDDEPTQAARLATEYARQFVRYRVEIDTRSLASTLSELRGQIERLEAVGDTRSPQYVRLVDREQQLESLRALRVSNINVVESARARDAEQVAPRPRRNAALAAAAGLVLGLLLVFLAENLGTRPRSEKELEELLDLPVLARIPLAPRAAAEQADAASDAVHTLRTRLELASGARAAKTIMVTSPHSGEGKRVVALRLAMALASAGRRVTIVDLDFRAPPTSRLTGLADAPGIASVLRGGHDLADAVIAVPFDDGALRRAIPGENGSAGGVLEVVPAGSPDVHPAALLSTEALASALDELGRRADVVLVDVPPVLEAPDAGAVAPSVDALLLVVSPRRARGPELAEVRRTIEGWPVAKLGVALTDGQEDASAAATPVRTGVPAVTAVEEPQRVA